MTCCENDEDDHHNDMKREMKITRAEDVKDKR